MATTADAVAESTAPRSGAHRPLWRRRGARWFAAAVVVAQLALVANGYRDPHNYFAFQPFNESSTYAVELVRALDDGQRVPVPNGRWEGYDWNELIDWGPLRSPWHQRHAFSGIDAVVDFLDYALDWMADNTPGDTETRYWEATVTYYRNARGPHVTVIRSHDRELGGP